MPKIRSALKRLRQSEKRRERNQAAKSRMKTAIKRVEQAIASGDITMAKESLRQAISIINRTVQKGIIHDNKAARLTSRLTLKVNSFLLKAKGNTQTPTPETMSP